MKKRSWIADRLADLGKTQVGLARAISKPSPRVSEIINGTRGIKANEAKIIADFLEISIDNFMSLENGAAHPAVPPSAPTHFTPEAAEMLALMQELTADERKKLLDMGKAFKYGYTGNKKAS